MNTVEFQLEEIPGGGWFVACPVCGEESAVMGEEQLAVNNLIVHMNTNHPRVGNA